MSTQADLSKAIRIAASAHEGQFDKQGVTYILHPLAVSARVESLDAKVVAVLHDVVEDTPWTLDALRGEGFASHIIEAVDALSRRQAETYSEYIARVIEGGPLPITVKIADIEDNTRPDRRHPDAESMSKRNTSALERLRAAISGPRP